MTDEPTTEEMQAVINFARRYGRDWKYKLNDAWMDGTDASEPDGHLLRRVRNTFGPQWLIKQPEIYK